MDLTDLKSRGRHWNEAVRERIARGRDAMPDLDDLRTQGRHWNEAAMDRIAAALPRRAPSRGWMLGMLAIGLAVGALIGGYAVARSMRSASEDERMGEGAAEGEADIRPVTVTTRRANHRSKPTSED